MFEIFLASKNVGFPVVNDNATEKELYPSITTILSVLLVMPVSTATPERSFIIMRRVKSYLRSTMTTEWLSALALVHGYRDMHIDPEAV